jgi:hypothetical protein
MDSQFDNLFYSKLAQSQNIPKTSPIQPSQDTTLFQGTTISSANTRLLIANNLIYFLINVNIITSFFIVF